MSCCRRITIAALCALFLLSSFRQEKENYGETIVTKRGDEITFTRPKEREVQVGNKLKRKVTTEKPKPVLINGKKIYHHEDDEKDLWKGTEADTKTIEEYLLFRKMIDSAIATEITHLPPGYYQYEMSNMVVDERGYIAYYETKGIVQYHPASNPFTKPRTTPVNPTSAYIINGIIARQANKIRYTSLIINGEPTAYLTAFGYSYDHSD